MKWHRVTPFLFVFNIHHINGHILSFAKKRGLYFFDKIKSLIFFYIYKILYINMEVNFRVVNKQKIE
jgi:hypothetical protein